MDKASRELPYGRCIDDIRRIELDQLVANALKLGMLLGVSRGQDRIELLLDLLHDCGVIGFVFKPLIQQYPLHGCIMEARAVQEIRNLSRRPQEGRDVGDSHVLLVDDVAADRPIQVGHGKKGAFRQASGVNDGIRIQRMFVDADVSLAKYQLQNFDRRQARTIACSSKAAFDDVEAVIQRSQRILQAQPRSL